MADTLYAVFGASGFGREVLPVLREQLGEAVGAEQIVFVDDNPRMDRINGHRVLNWPNFLGEPAPKKEIAIAIADGVSREKLFRRCRAAGVTIRTVRSPTAVSMDDVVLGVGAILTSFVTLTSNIKIGRCFHANLYSYVAHDCTIGDFVTFAPRVMCNGNVVIEDHAYIGAGAIIKQGRPGTPLIIGRGAIIGMGAVVTKSVPANTTVVGNPARPLTR